MSGTVEYHGANYAGKDTGGRRYTALWQRGCMT